MLPLTAPVLHLTAPVLHLTAPVLQDGLLPIDLCTDHAMRDMCRPVNGSFHVALLAALTCVGAAVPQQQLQQTMAAGQQYGLQQTMAVAPGAVAGLGLHGDNAESIVNSVCEPARAALLTAWSRSADCLA